jgi:RhtB (resistance to homoserine/threonine) family protein
MENIFLLGSIAVINLLAVMSPGPDFVMAVRNSLVYSRRTGIMTAIGFGFGIIVHITYCIAGLAVVISKSIILFNIIKIFGAGYLMYIGIQSILSKSHAAKIDNKITKPDLSAFSGIKIGFITNVLNPKATLFYLGLFTLVISPDTPIGIQIIGGAIMVFEIIVWFSLVAVFFTNKHIRSRFDKLQNMFNKAFGGLLLLLGIKIALTSNK